MRFWLALGILVSTLMTLLIVSTFITDDGAIIDTFLRNEGHTALLMYALLGTVAFAGALMFRSRWAITVIPLTMLATWVLFDRIACPECWQDYGRTYSMPGSSEIMSAPEAHVVLRSLQLSPTLLGAIIGASITGNWLKQSTLHFRQSLGRYTRPGRSGTRNAG